MFSSTFFKKNRSNLRAKFESDSLFIFTANGLIQRSGSTTFPFRQDSNFWYLTGLNEPDLIMVIAGDDEFIILPSRNDTFALFSGIPNERQLLEKSGVSNIFKHDEGLGNLKQLIVKNKKVRTCTPKEAYLDSGGFYTNPARQKLASTLLDISPSLELIDTSQELANMRSVKQPEEIRAVESAISISVAAFSSIKNNLSQYHTEKEIVQALGAEFLLLGADGHAYDPIVATGANACTLHYLNGNSDLRPGEPVLIDAGAELNNYSSDLTRTYSLSTPTKRQEQLHQAVMEIRTRALDRLKPGVGIADYEKEVRSYALGLISKLNVSSTDIKKYYPHSTSHFIGLDVHDPGDYKSVFKENMILTVEPGIYISEEKLGIRIEDNILITKTSHKNLSEQLSRDLI